MSKNFLFIGFAIPNNQMSEIELKDKFPAIQTHKFIWNFIKGLEFQNIIKSTYLSTRPVSDYPYYPQKIIKANKWNIFIFEKEKEIIEIPFINIGLLKIISRFFSVLYFGFSHFHKNNKDGIIVYSVHTPFMLAGYILSKIYKTELIYLWTDPPAVPNKLDSKLKSYFRNIELKLSKYLMSKANKVIVLTKYLATDYAPEKPYLVIEGIIDETDIRKKKINRNPSEIVKIVYTGSISKRYGIKNIVDGFRMLNPQNAVLEIYGSGDYSNELIEICKEVDNVIYKGFVTHKKILNIQQEADFLINARSPSEEYVKYSFPSKTLEYMSSGTPLISTMLPGIPLEYEKYILVLDNNNPKTIMLKLKEAISMDINERLEIGVKAQKFVENKSYKIQGKKITEFLLSDFKR